MFTHICTHLLRVRSCLHYVRAHHIRFAFALHSQQIRFAFALHSQQIRIHSLRVRIAFASCSVQICPTFALYSHLFTLIRNYPHMFPMYSHKCEFTNSHGHRTLNEVWHSSAVGRLNGAFPPLYLPTSRSTLSRPHTLGPYAWYVPSRQYSPVY